MKKIIRLTESDLHNIIKHSVKKILKEEKDKTLILQSIAQKIANGGKISAKFEDNEIELDIDDNIVYISFDASPKIHYEPAYRSNNRDVPDDPAEIVEDAPPTVHINSITYYNDYNDGINILDNGIVKQALENKIEMEYDDDIYDYFEDDGYYDEWDR